MYMRDPQLFTNVQRRDPKSMPPDSDSIPTRLAAVHFWNSTISENPTLNLSFFALMRFNLRAEKPFEAAIAVRPLHPFGDSERVLLVGRSSRTRKSSVPKCRVVQPPLSDWAERSSRRTDGLSDVAHSRNASVCRLGYRPLHVEMEHGFGCPCPQFGQPPPARIA